MGLAIGHVVDPDVAVRPEKDPQVFRAFAWLSGRVGQPAGTTVNRPTPKASGGVYYMWAMERIAVLYDVRSLDQKDWYLWGAEILLSHQKPQGNWEDAGQHVEHPALSTALALLFPKRANLTPDLSRRLVVDPAALTKKVSETVSPKQPPVTPTPKPPETAATGVAPMPRVVVPTPRDPPSETTTTVVTTPTPAAPAPEAKNSRTIWILLLVVLLAIVAVCAFLVFRKMRGEEEEARPKKKKKKLKAKVQD